MKQARATTANRRRAGRGLVLAAFGLAAAGAAQAQQSFLPGGNSHAPVNINADKLDYFDKEQKLVYSGNVVARQGEASLRSATLTIYMNGNPAKSHGEAAPAATGNDQVRRMEARGSVTIVQKDQVGTGDEGLYDRAENKVYLIGNVTLSQGSNVVKGAKGAKLVYDLSTGQAHIIGGVTSIFTPGSGSEDSQKKRPEPKPGNRPR
jgi:lipopolysaccharide export system protein LptA